MFSSPLHKDPRLPELYTLYKKKVESQDRIRELKKRIQATHDVLQMEELKARKRVLRRLGFTTSADIVDMKGRVACEISTGDELLLTELIFNGAFNSLSPEQCAGLLSCFVFTEKVRALMYIFVNPLTIVSERASHQAEGGAGGPSSCHAGDCAANRQSLQGVQAPHRRRGVRPVIQGRTHGRGRPVVSRSVFLRDLQGS